MLSFFLSKWRVQKTNHYNFILETKPYHNNSFFYSLVSGLVAVNAGFYTRHPIDPQTCLAMVKDATEILATLLDGGKSVVAGRLAGAFRNIGKDKIADHC